MPLAVYIHIPYCLQRCRYCDFATFEFTEIEPPEYYVAHVLEEIRQRRKFWPHNKIHTVYFGGGTPSLIAPELIVSICRELANAGLEILPDAELTLEINPATLDEERLQAYLRAGFNRFSVGAQTFNDRLLKLCNRRHTANDTRETLALLKKYNLNYSFDLLFALPSQSMIDLKNDLDIVAEYRPPHLSAYCLTVPEGHPMNKGRAPEGEQVEMFAMIEGRLAGAGLAKYEVSNFARPGFESKHNSVYWSDQSYWGIGLSSHSYFRESDPYGMRFWNPKSLSVYKGQAGNRGLSYQDVLPPEQYECLKVHEALTDYAHVRLRTTQGLLKDALQNKFPEAWVEVAKVRLNRLVERGLVICSKDGWALSREGFLVSNKVFEELCFLPADVQTEALTPQAGDSYCAV